MNADLHCHSCHSDGVLSPAALAARAAANGVELWSLTDHDNLGGLDEAREQARVLGMRFINGVEISVTWHGTTIHIVGLGIDPRHAPLEQGLASVRSGRDERALRMAEALEALGVRDAYANAMRHAGNPSLVGRSHFARVLVEQGYAQDVHAVFRDYLVRGRPGYIEHQWTALDQAVAWIRGAGGVAVVAHPGRYRISGDQLLRLLGDFRDAGGAGHRSGVRLARRDRGQEFRPAGPRFRFLRLARVRLPCAGRKSDRPRTRRPSAGRCRAGVACA